MDHLRKERDTIQAPKKKAAPSAPARAVQAKLAVGSADDPLEHEADAVADRVVRSLAGEAVGDEPSPAVEGAGVQRMGLSARASVVARASDPIGAEGGDLDASTEQSIRSAGGGQSLPTVARSQMEGAFGADFGGVRVHQGPQARNLNDQIQAKAFTSGNDVFFRDGMPDTTTPAGQHLLAHELTHTVQQGAAVSRRFDTTRDAATGRRTTSIQRMPSSATLKEKSGKESKEGKSFFGKKRGATNTYNAVLSALDSYRNYLTSTEIGSNPNQVLQQISTIGGLVGKISAAARTYLAKKQTDPTVAQYCTDMLAMAPLELRAASDIGAKFMNKTSNSLGLGGTKWILHMPRDARTYKPQANADTKATTVTSSGGSDSGANKEVSKATNSKGESGFFAEDDATGQYSGETWDNPAWIVQNYGQHDQDLRLAQRSIAMSRLDTLLKGGVIAHTEAAVMNGKQGTFMIKAVGDKAIDSAMKNDDMNDPELARLLSRMQLIDAIAGQVDRHIGNYYIQRDTSGKVIGVTGIDLDMAWVGGQNGEQGFGQQRGKHDDPRDLEFDVKKGAVKKGTDNLGPDHYPGLSMYVDKQMADVIIALKADDLRAILIDLLSPPAIQAAVERLNALQGELKKMKNAGKLLNADEWTAARRGQLKNDSASYFAAINR